MAAYIGINGMGVLGRRLLRMLVELGYDKNYPATFEIGQINDPNMTAEQLVYLLKHDTVYGTWGKASEAPSSSAEDR